MNYVSVDFWKNKKVLITGHSGFKGSWLTCFILNLDSQVLGISLEKLNIEHPKFSQAILDIRDLKNLSKLVGEFQPDIIFHLAAQAFVFEGYREPIETLQVNVMGTANILEAARTLKSLSSILIVTTDKVYKDVLLLNKKAEIDTLVGHGVDDPLGANEIYGASKASAEIITSAYRESFFRSNYSKKIKQIGIATARAGNVLGPGDSGKNRLVPDFFRAYMNLAPLKLRNPKAVRPWQHIYDLCIGYLLLIQKMEVDPIKFSRPWNFGNENTQCDVYGLIYLLNNHLKNRGMTEVLIKEDLSQENFHERKILQIDSKETEIGLDWYPEFSLEKISENLVDGFLVEDKNLRNFMLNASQLYLNKYIV